MNDRELEALVEDICQSHTSKSSKQSSLIPILQDIQENVGYLPKRALSGVSSNLGVPPSHVYGVATFYHQFRLLPKGKQIITICRGTACHVAGATENYDFIMRYLKINPPGDTSPDGEFTVSQVRCIGACSLAPVIKIGDEIYGRVTPNNLPRIIDRHRSMKEASNGE